MPATACPIRWQKWRVLMAVMIGIDPHEGSHTAVAVGAAEEPLGKTRIRACPAAGRLGGWLAGPMGRFFAPNCAAGLSVLQAQATTAERERSCQRARASRAA
jgi:hypothetical protein